VGKKLVEAFVSLGSIPGELVNNLLLVFGAAGAELSPRDKLIVTCVACLCVGGVLLLDYFGMLPHQRKK
jgi:hypothetical protein